jgi:hypothetical protein
MTSTLKAQVRGGLAPSAPALERSAPALDPSALALEPSAPAFGSSAPALGSFDVAPQPFDVALHPSAAVRAPRIVGRHRARVLVFCARPRRASYAALHRRGTR